MWSNFKTAHHNLKMTITRQQLFLFKPFLHLNNLFRASPSTCPTSNNSKTTLKPCKQHPNFLCPKNATYTQTPPNFTCTSHQHTPMQSTTPQSSYIKVHEATTKKMFGQQAPQPTPPWLWLEGEKKKPWNPNFMKKMVNNATDGWRRAPHTRLGKAPGYWACGRRAARLPQWMKCHYSDPLYGHLEQTSLPTRKVKIACFFSSQKRHWLHV
jgi:hypothetical protein